MPESPIVCFVCEAPDARLPLTGNLDWMNHSPLPCRSESSVPDSAPDLASELRSRCRGVVPLDAIWSPWMTQLAANPDRVKQLIEFHGSPVNVLSADPMRSNINDLRKVAERANVPMQIHFARKANKCAEFVRTGLLESIGFDVASESELEEAFDELHGSPQHPSEDAILCTAAVKPASLIRSCVLNDVVLVIDNDDELATLCETLADLGPTAPKARIAFRLQHCPTKFPGLPSRFGMPTDELTLLAKSIGADARIQVVGIHFHVHRSHEQFAPSFTRALIVEALHVVDRVRGLGHTVAWLDIGGGFPVNYLRDQMQLKRFLTKALASVETNGRFASDLKLTWNQRPLTDIDPAWQPLSAANWLREVLTPSLANEINRRELILKCEPGRSLLDGCGVTIAEVLFVKRDQNRNHLIGLMMNSSQCRTTRDDFLVDPIVISASNASAEQTEKSDHAEMEGYFVGGYCTESEYLMQRKFRFPNGISRGDFVLIPNTAAYQMHFAESRAHQLPLAENVFI